MFKAGGKSHLAETFRWAAKTRIETAEVLAAGLGMAGPVLILLIMDAGQPVNCDLVIERLVATLIGAALVALISFVFRRMVSFSATMPLALLQKWP